MNIIALCIALVGIVVVLLGFYVARRITSKIGAGIVQIAALILGFLAVLAFPVDLEVASQAGTYWFVGLIISAVAGKIISKRSAADTKNA